MYELLKEIVTEGELVLLGGGGGGDREKGREKERKRESLEREIQINQQN